MSSKVKHSPLRRQSSGQDGVTTDDESLSVSTFQSVNARPVTDITLDFFYQPHTLTLLAASILWLTHTAFTRDAAMASQSDNLFVGFLGVFAFFMTVSALTFPNGPFTRPHPAFWSMAFGASVMYLMLLQFLVHQDYPTVRSLLVWIDPALQNYTLEEEKEYGADCWDITWERLYSHLDVFAFGHFWGWGLKALIIRHYGICWTISIMWELTEMAFGHLLPNFYECWWDNVLLDVLLCNGLGIFVGMRVCAFMEMREFHWESLRDISSRTGKIKRALLQFTPGSWTPVRWMDPHCSWMRFVAIFQLMVCWQIVELNTFFFKHVFPMPAGHPICVIRMLLMGLWAAPSAKQYYSFITDPTCGRLGTQAWVYICLACSELILNVKFGLEDLFSHTQLSKMLIWVGLQLVLSCLGMYASMRVYRWRYGDGTSAVQRRRRAVVERERQRERSLSEEGEAVRQRKVKFVME